MNPDRRATAETSPALPRLSREPAGVARTTSQALFGGGDLLLIEHRGETYTLRQTRQGKLILNK